jgi:hypothetical protein
MRQITDRFLAAVKLCVGSDPVKQRLAKAWTTELEDIGISELPEQLRPEFCRLRSVLNTAEPQPHESAAEASIRKMSARQATRQTQRILQMSQKLMLVCYQAESALQKGQRDEFNVRGMSAAERLN